MKTIVALLSTVVVLAAAAPAGAMPIDNSRSAPPRTPSTTPAPASPSSGTQTWVVIAVGAFAFAAGSAATRLAPAVRV